MASERRVNGVGGGGAMRHDGPSLEVSSYSWGPSPAVAAARWNEVDNGGGGGQEPVYDPISLDHTATILWVHALIPLIPPVWVCVFAFCLFICLTHNRAFYFSQTV